MRFKNVLLAEFVIIGLSLVDCSRVKAQALEPPLPQGSTYYKGRVVSQIGVGVIGCTPDQYMKADASGCAKPALPFESIASVTVTRPGGYGACPTVATNVNGGAILTPNCSDIVPGVYTVDTITVNNGGCFTSPPYLVFTPVGFPTTLVTVNMQQGCGGSVGTGNAGSYTKWDTSSALGTANISQDSPLTTITINDSNDPNAGIALWGGSNGITLITEAGFLYPDTLDGNISIDAGYGLNLVNQPNVPNGSSVNIDDNDSGNGGVSIQSNGLQGVNIGTPLSSTANIVIGGGGDLYLKTNPSPSSSQTHIYIVNSSTDSGASISLGNNGTHSGGAAFYQDGRALINGVLLTDTIYSVAGTPLPSCTPTLNGGKLVVSDATLPTFLGTYSGGGGFTSPVICDGTNWLTY